MSGRAKTAGLWLAALACGVVVVGPGAVAARADEPTPGAAPESDYRREVVVDIHKVRFGMAEAEARALVAGLTDDEVACFLENPRMVRSGGLTGGEFALFIAVNAFLIVAYVVGGGEHYQRDPYDY